MLFDRILPSEFGVREPLFYSSDKVHDESLIGADELPSIKIVNLTKEFSNVTALNNFSVNINENQI